MGLGDLKKGEGQHPALTPEVDALVNAAKVDGKTVLAKRRRTAKPKRVFTRVTFSLTAAIEAEIDRLSLIPRTFHATRSDVVRAALALLAEQGDEEVTRLLKAEKARK